MKKGLRSSPTSWQAPRAGTPRLILSGYVGGERPARAFRDPQGSSMSLSEHTRDQFLGDITLPP